jgi:hypothetical protein
MNELESKLAVMEGMKPIPESKLVDIIKEITHKFEESEKSIEESLKQFCESTCVT